MAFKELTVELNTSIFSTRKTDLHTKFLELLETQNCSDTSYSSWKLKQKLQAYYGDKISFIERPGLTDFLCSTQNNIAELNHLFSTQEEADTRVINPSSCRILQCGIKNYNSCL